MVIKINYPKNRYTGPKPWMDKEWLYNEYIVKNRSTQEIADEYGCKRNTIQCWLIKHQIKKEIKKQIDDYDYLYHVYVIKEESLRTIANNNHTTIDDIKQRLNNYNIPIRNEPVKKRKFDDDINDIVSLYYNDKLSAYEIGKLYKTSHKTIIELLQRHGYKTRNRSDAQLTYNGIEVDAIFYDAEKLNQLHNKLHLSCEAIGDMIGVSPGAVRRQMQRFGLHTDNDTESKIGLMTGENHPNWQGGKSSLYQLLREYSTTNLAPKVRKKDKNVCQICGRSESVMHTHHIVTFKIIIDDICNEHPELNQYDPVDKQALYTIITNDSRFLDLNNMQTLCKNCHIKIHSKTISNQAS